MTINEMLTKIRAIYPHWNPKSNNQIIAVYNRIYVNTPIVKKQPEPFYIPECNYVQMSLFD